jgi:hypothetical protein
MEGAPKRAAEHQAKYLMEIIAMAKTDPVSASVILGVDAKITSRLANIPPSALIDLASVPPLLSLPHTKKNATNTLDKLLTALESGNSEGIKLAAAHIVSARF